MPAPIATIDTANWLVHPFSGAVGAIVLSAAVRALPEPGTTGPGAFSFFGACYAWLFRFANGVLANFDLAGSGFNRRDSSYSPAPPAAVSSSSVQPHSPLPATGDLIALHGALGPVEAVRYTNGKAPGV
ncbi:MAG TPA: hypothetical protein VNH18_29530 [Bryobacteraceae bacterium]|nr:hypothetical protein [Blastocatellia bacterium]HXJ43460.1 hypothetical protein [Bryobacteraceae bacterium]